jgi:outer membrane autotransporter protein
VTVNPAPIALGTVKLTVKAGGDASVDLTEGASGGPFTAANVVSLSPAEAGTTSISVQIAAAPVAGKGAAAPGSGSSAAATPGPHYILTFKPSPTFSGPATVTFTISNAFATSAPGQVVFTIEPRPDPTLDPNVGALIAAQTEAARRFGEAQIENFDRRLESLHHGGRAGSVNGLSFGLDSDVEDPWEAARRRQAGGLWPVGPDRVGSANASVNPKAATAAGRPASATEGDPDRPSGLAFWSGGALDLGLHRGSATLAKFRFTTSGVSFGADYRLSDRLTLGAGAGYGHDQSRIDDDGSKVTANNYVGAIYGDYRLGPNTFIDAVIGHGSLSFDSHRAIAADATFADGARHGQETFASITAGYDVHRGPLLVTTYGRLDTIRGALDAFTETEIGGGSNALSFNRQTLSVLTSTLGLRGGYSVQTRAGLWSPHLRIEYKYDFETAGLATLQYADALSGPTYSRPADPLNQSRFVLGVGSDLHFRDVSLSLDYQASAEGREELVHQIIAKFALRF